MLIIPPISSVLYYTVLLGYAVDGIYSTVQAYSIGIIVRGKSFTTRYTTLHYTIQLPRKLSIYPSQ
jgi:hypothetical protein